MKKRKAKQNIIQKQNSFEYYLLIILFVIIIPLTHSNNTLDPTVPRLLYWGISLFVIYVLTYFNNKNKNTDLGFIRLWVFIVYGLYLLISIASLTQAINPAEGFHDLAKTILTLFSLVIIVFILNQQYSFKNFVVKSVVISSIIAPIIGISQYAKLTDNASEIDFYIALYEIKGLMANKNQFAISLFLMLPFSVFGAFKFNNWWKYISIVSVILLIISFVFIQTRSVWVAVFAFVTSFGLFYFVNKKGLSSNINFKFKKAIAPLVILIIIALISTIILFQKTNSVGVFQTKVSSLFDLESKDNTNRLQLWESTIHMSSDHLLLGVGAGNWKISIIPYYSYKIKDEYVNWIRPHNDFLWALSEKGVFGLLTYLLIFILTAFYGIKTLLTKTDAENKLYTRLMLSGLFGYLAIAMFTFPYERINHQIYLTLIMGGIISNYYKLVLTAKVNHNLLTLIKLLVPLAMVTLSIFYAAVFYKSEINIKKYVIESKSKKPNTNKLIEYSNKAFSPFTTLDSQQVPIHLYKGICMMKLKKTEASIEEYKKAYMYHPYSFAVTNNLGYAYSSVGRYKDAINIFKESLILFPDNEEVTINLAGAYYLAGNYIEARKTLLRCKPNSINPKIHALKNLLSKKI